MCKKGSYATRPVRIDNRYSEDDIEQQKYSICSVF